MKMKLAEIAKAIGAENNIEQWKSSSISYI